MTKKSRKVKQLIIYENLGASLTEYAKHVYIQDCEIEFKGKIFDYEDVYLEAELYWNEDLDLAIKNLYNNLPEINKKKDVKFVAKMIKSCILFLLLILSFSNIKAQNYDIPAKINSWIDNPELFIYDICPFKIVKSGPTVTEYCNRMYENTTNIIENTEYRKEFVKKTVSDFAYNFVLFAPIMFEAGKLINVSTPKVAVDLTVIQNCIDASETINKIKSLGGCRKIITEDVIQHIKDRHFPGNKIGNKSQHLFCEMTEDEMFKMMDKILEQNKMSPSKYNGLLIFKGKLLSKAGVMREYALIISPETGMIQTFYPMRALSEDQLLRSGYDLNYLKSK
jgi:hypothetical protein